MNNYMNLFDEADEDPDFFADMGDDHQDDTADDDEPSSLKPARLQSTIDGHTGVEKKLLELIASNRLPQSLIFTGAGGIGKATMAFRLARYLFKYKNTSEEGGLFGGADLAPPPPADSLSVPETDIVFQQVASGGWPDLLVIDRQEDEKGKLKPHDLEQIRAVTSFFRRTASQDGGWRIAIIDDADTLNWHAQNALLKILEEPPAKSMLILISHRIGAMLPTILSRSSVINFQSIPDYQIRDFLKKYAPVASSDMEQIIVQMAAGSIGQALYYAEQSRSDIIEMAVGLFSGWPTFDWMRIQLFAETIGSKGSDESSQAAFRDAMLWIADTLIRSRSLDKPLPAGLADPVFKTILQRLDLSRLLEISDRLKEHFHLVQSGSLDKRFMVMGAYSIWED